jgi:hypothetical protein
MAQSATDFEASGGGIFFKLTEFFWGQFAFPRLALLLKDSGNKSSHKSMGHGTWRLAADGAYPVLG